LRRRVEGAACLALILAACATSKPTSPPTPTPTPTPAPTQPGGPSVPPASSTPLSFKALPGWRDEDHVAALAAFASTCGVSLDPAMSEACRRARALPSPDAKSARAFFEDAFVLAPEPELGVLTAYFAPEYEARSAPEGEFTAPLRGRPADLVVLDSQTVVRRSGGATGSYPDRAAIEAQAPGQVQAWMRPEELFFLQVQGSGVLTFPDGRRLKAGVAATNGRNYVAIGKPMREQGLLAADDTSADSIRNWLAAHRGPEADAVMRLNPRYVFFNLVPDNGRPPFGAAGVPLPAGRAVAVDRSLHAMGELLWIDGSKPVLAGAPPFYRRLAVALDVGGAIKGAARADLYLGQGAAAGSEAGRVRHELRLYRLVPRTADR